MSRPPFGASSRASSLTWARAAARAPAGLDPWRGVSGFVDRHDGAETGDADAQPGQSLERGPGTTTGALAGGRQCLGLLQERVDQSCLASHRLQVDDLVALAPGQAGERRQGRGLTDPTRPHEDGVLSVDPSACRRVVEHQLPATQQVAAAGKDGWAVPGPGRIDTVLHTFSFYIHLYFNRYVGVVGVHRCLGPPVWFEQALRCPRGWASRGARRVGGRRPAPSYPLHLAGPGGFGDAPPVGGAWSSGCRRR